MYLLNIKINNAYKVMHIKIGLCDCIKTKESTSAFENELQLETLVSKISVLIIFSHTKIKKKAINTIMADCFLKNLSKINCIKTTGRKIKKTAYLINISLKEQSMQPEDISFAYAPI